MSLSEIIEAGAPHPWANFRINNLTVDGTLTAGTFNAGALTADSLTFNGANQTALTDYEEFTFNLALGGAISITVVSCRAVRIGKIVTINIPAATSLWTAVVTDIFASAGSLPSRIRPAVTQTVPYVVQDFVNNPRKPAIMQFFNDGSVRVPDGLDPATLFAAGGFVGGLVLAMTVSYNLN